MADPVIGLFMEDIAQGNFITSIISRIASERDLRVTFEIRNATGGVPKMRGETIKILVRPCTNWNSCLRHIDNRAGCRFCE